MPYEGNLGRLSTADSRQVWCNLHSVRSRSRARSTTCSPTPTDAGYEATARLIRDWTQHGLLDYPQQTAGGQGPRLGPRPLPGQPAEPVANPAAPPAGQEHQQPRQDPGRHLDVLGRGVRPAPAGAPRPHALPGRPAAAGRYARDAGRASKERARAAARAILGQMDNPRATPAARRELLDVLTEAAYTGRPDFDRLERAVSAVFEPGTTHIRRAIGHPAAPVTTEAMISITKARLAAVTALTAGQVTDEALIQARDAHLFGYAEYIARQPVLAAVAPARHPAAVRARHRGRHADQLLRAPAVGARAGDPVPAAGRADAPGPRLDVPPRARRLWPHLRGHRSQPGTRWRPGARLSPEVQ